MLRFLIRAPNWLGDGVMSLPAVRAVADSFPGARLSVVGSRPVVELYRRALGDADYYIAPPSTLRGRLRGMPALAEELRRRRHGIALVLPGSFSSALLARLAGARERVGYDMEGRGRLLTRPVDPAETEGLHLADQYLRLAAEVGARPRPRERLVEPTDADRRLASALLAQAGLDPDGPFLALSPGAAFGETKQWSPLKFGDLGREVVALYGIPAIVIGSAAERPLAEIVASRSPRRLLNLAGRTSLGALIALLERAKLVISNDSGPMHVAAGAGAKVVAVFGSTDPGWTAPLGTGHRVVYHELDCSPCLARTCDIGRVCLTSVTVAEVLAQVQQALFQHHQLAPNPRIALPPALPSIAPAAQAARAAAGEPVPAARRFSA